MNQPNLRKMTLTALFSALTCIATALFPIRMPATQGYVNLGDCFVLMGAWILGPLWGAFAGGVGSALADLLTGYAHYAPGTLLIKGLMAAIAGVLLCRRRGSHLLRRRLIGGVIAELWMVLGYFIYAWMILGNGAAAASIPGNLLQGAIGIVAALTLTTALQASGAMKKVNHNE